MIDIKSLEKQEQSDAKLQKKTKEKIPIAKLQIGRNKTQGINEMETTTNNKYKESAKQSWALKR